MIVKSNRSVLAIAAAIVIAGVLISASLLVETEGATKTMTATSTGTETTTYTTTSVITTPVITTSTQTTTVTTTILPTTTTTSTQKTSTGTSTICTISGGPGPVELRILSNSTLSPVIGAQVSATNQPATCGVSIETVNFTTNSTEWYSLDGTNNLAYSFMVSYSGQNYSFTAYTHPLSATCVTLYIPSGATSTTVTEYGDTCSA